MRASHIVLTGFDAPYLRVSRNAEKVVVTQ